MDTNNLTKEEEAILWQELRTLLWQPDESLIDHSEELEEKTTQNPGQGNDDLWKENEDLKKENQELKVVAQKAVQKKNKRKDKYSEAMDRISKIKNGELDDEYPNEYERDMDAVKLQSEATYAQQRMDEESEVERESFYSDNKFAKEHQDAIEELVTQNWLDHDSAYKLFLAKNHPEKLYDVQKVRQSKGWNDMIGGARWSNSWDDVQELSTTELEKQLTDAHARGEWTL